MDLDQALVRFDRVEANLLRLEKAWAEIQRLTPRGIAFGLGSSPDGQRYRDLCRSYQQLLGALPAIDGCKITAEPWDLEDIASWRVDSMEADIGPYTAVDRYPDQIDWEIGNYRFNLTQARRTLVREPIVKLNGELSGL